MELEQIWIEIYSGERKEEDRVGERMILIGLAKKDTFDINHQYEEYQNK